MSTDKQYQYLEPRPCSLYRQPFLKGTRVRVEIPYGRIHTVIDEIEGEIPGDSPEQLAADFRVPVEAILEAIDYCEKHWEVILADHAREERLVEATGMNHPDYKFNPKKYHKLLTPQEWSRIFDDEDLPGR
jgi:uncharacterized protein (DUF433 family)